MGEYDNITSLVKKDNGKKIMIQRDSWADGGYAIVNKLILKSEDDKFGSAIGHIHYANGNKINGALPCAGCYSWKLLKVFDDQETEIIIKPKS